MEWTDPQSCSLSPMGQFPINIEQLHMQLFAVHSIVFHFDQQRGGFIGKYSYRWQHNGSEFRLRYVIIFLNSRRLCRFSQFSWLLSKVRCSLYGRTWVFCSFEVNSRRRRHLFWEIQCWRATENILWFCFDLKIVWFQRQLLLKAGEMLGIVKQHTSLQECCEAAGAVSYVACFEHRWHFPRADAPDFTADPTWLLFTLPCFAVPFITDPVELRGDDGWRAGQGKM